LKRLPFYQIIAADNRRRKIMVDTEWLSEVICDSCHIPPTIKVISFESEPLKGGCHFNTFKLSLTYSKSNEQLPGSVVMRTIEWNNKFYRDELL
jgi:hypothetical protein